MSKEEKARLMDLLAEVRTIRLMHDVKSAEAIELMVEQAADRYLRGEPTVYRGSSSD